MQRFLRLLTFVSVLLFPVAGHATCKGLEQVNEPILHGVMNALLAGDYPAVGKHLGSAFINNSGPDGSIIKGLSKYAPKGFAACRLVLQETMSPVVSKYVLELAGHNNGDIFLYAMTLAEDDGFNGGFASIWFSTEVYKMMNMWYLGKIVTDPVAAAK